MSVRANARAPDERAATPPMPVPAERTVTPTATATDVSALPMLNLSLHDAPREEEPFIGEEHAEEPARYVLKINEAERAASTRAQASFLRIRRALRRKVRVKVAFGNKADQQGLRLSENARGGGGGGGGGGAAAQGARSAPKFPIIHATVPAKDVDHIDNPRALTDANLRIREVTIHAFEMRKHIQGLIASAKAKNDEDEYKRQVAALDALPCGTKMLTAAPGMPAAIKRAAQARGIAFEHGLAKNYKTRKATEAEKTFRPEQTETVQLNPHSNPEISSSYVAVYISPRMDSNYTATEFQSWEPLFAALHQTLKKMLPIGQYENNIPGLVQQTVKIGKQFRNWQVAHGNHEFHYAMPYSKGESDTFASTRDTFAYMANGGEEWHDVPDAEDVQKSEAIPVRLNEQQQAMKYYKHIAFNTKHNVWPFLKVNADVWEVCRELNVEQLPPVCRPLFVLLKSKKLTDVCERINGNRNGIYVSLGKFFVDKYYSSPNAADFVSLKFNLDFVEVPHIIASNNRSGQIEYNVSQLFAIIVLTGMRYFEPISQKIVQRKEQQRAKLKARSNAKNLVMAMQHTVRDGVYAIKTYGDYLTDRENSDDTEIIRGNRYELKYPDLLMEGEAEKLQQEIREAKERRDEKDSEFKAKAFYQEIKKNVGFYKRREDFYEQFASIIAHTYKEKPFGNVYTGNGTDKLKAGLFDAMGPSTKRIRPNEQWKRIFTVWARSAKGSLNYERWGSNDECMGTLRVGTEQHVFPALAHFETPRMGSFFEETGSKWVSDALCDWSTEYIRHAPIKDPKNKGYLPATFTPQGAEATREIGVKKWTVWAALNILRAVDDDSQLEIAHQIGKRFYSNYESLAGEAVGRTVAATVRMMALRNFFELMEKRFQQAVEIVKYKKQLNPDPNAPATLSEPDKMGASYQPITKAYTEYGPGFVLAFYSAAASSDLEWKVKSMGKMKATPINRISRPNIVRLQYPGEKREVSADTPAFKALSALRETLAFLYEQALDVCDYGAAGRIKTHTQPSIKGVGKVAGTEFRAMDVKAVDMQDAAPGSSAADSDSEEDDDDGGNGEDGDGVNNDGAEEDATGAADEPPGMSDELITSEEIGRYNSTVDPGGDLMGDDGYMTVNDAFLQYNRVDLLEEADVALEDPDVEYGVPEEVVEGLHETYEHAIEDAVIDVEPAKMDGEDAGMDVDAMEMDDGR